MKRMYLMKGMAALALCAVAVSCNRLEFSGQPEVSKEDAIANAELQLGASIDPNQDWNMAAEATANVSVFKNFGETYTVKVCSSNPMVDDVAYVLAEGSVAYGNVFSKKFRYASGLKKLFVAVTDSKGYTSVSVVPVENGELNVSFGTPNVSPVSRRSISSPEVPDIKQPYDETWVANYLRTASEPEKNNPTDGQNNCTDNYDNSYTSEGSDPVIYNPINDAQTVYYGGTITDKRLEAFILKWIKPYFDALWNGGSWSAIGATDATSGAKILVAEIAKAGYNFSDLINGNPGSTGGYVEDPTYVTNFKIIGTWNGQIEVAGSEGIIDGGTLSHAERTIVVTGTWNITEDQRIGSLGKIIIANGGTVNVASGKQLNMVNQARLVVLPGGKLTGAGSVEVNNGNATGLENYNGGIIDVASFNNNFGKFYNHGKFLVNEYLAGATESNFYNHALVAIDHTTGDANARIFNGCQFYVKNDARLRNYEGVNGSALIVGGQFMPFGSEDGTTVPSNVSLAAGALVKCGSLYNGSSWDGPTEGYAALEIVNQIDYLNWVQDSPETAGYFANNIYVKCGNWENDPAGQGYHQDDASDEYNYQVSRASYKFFNIAANCKGNNGVTKVLEGDTELLPADPQFVLGVSGCSPGFTGDGDPGETTPEIWSYAFEDTAVGDYDLNDVVLKAQENGDNIELKLVAAGATLNLEIRLYEYDAQGTNGYGSNYIVLSDNNGNTEVHDILGVDKGTMVNTGGSSANANPYTFTVSKSQYDASKLRLAIYSESQGEVRLSGSGDTPHGVMIPYDWRWPTERTRVTIAYNKTNAPETETDQSFTNFMSNAGHAEVWYKYPTKSTMNK